MNRTLLSLAIIRTNWKLYRHDYIENFIPFFATLIMKRGYNEISLENIEQIRDDFKKEFGLVIPSNPVLTILNRLSKKRFVIRDSNKFIPNKEKLSTVDLSLKSAQISREFEHVCTALKNYVKANHDVDVAQKEIEDGLISYLKKYDLDLLFAAENKSILPKIQPNQKLQYFINEFVGDVFRREPQLFQFILDLTIGHALSATILFDDFNKYTSSLRGLNLFLDTPFIFNLLGIHGGLKKSLAEELIQILQEESVNLYVLEITQTEVTANLEEALKLLERGKTDPTKGTLTYKACIEHGFNENDIEQMLLNLSDFYKSHKIENTDIPNYDDFREYQIDEEKLYQTIVDTYDGIIHGSRPKADKSPGENGNTQKGKSQNGEKKKEEKINYTILRDVQVLSGVYRYRLGNTPKTLKDCKYLFITTNSALAHASRRFEKSEHKQRYSLPTCLTDIFLGTLIWLHSPSKLETINEKKIIADSYAALRPDDKLIARYLEDVERLKNGGIITEESYILLRTHRAAINILENKTFGDISEFTSQTAEEILEELIAKLKGKEREKFLQEKERSESAQSDLGEKQKQLDELYRNTRIQQHEEIQVKINSKKKILRKAERKSIIWIKILQLVLIILLTASLIVMALNQFDIIEFPNWFIYITTTFVGILNIASWSNIASIRKRLRLIIYYRYKTRYCEQIEQFGFKL